MITWCELLFLAVAFVRESFGSNRGPKGEGSRESQDCFLSRPPHRLWINLRSNYAFFPTSPGNNVWTLKSWHTGVARLRTSQSPARMRLRFTARTDASQTPSTYQSRLRHKSRVVKSGVVRFKESAADGAAAGRGFTWIYLAVNPRCKMPSWLT